MCGIVGCNWEDSNLVKRMTNSLKHRGPDGQGYYNDRCISLGHRRLSIIDLSERGKQPMSNGEGTIWITYNGEIYNYKLLRKELEKKKYKFRTESDTETIIYAYEEYSYRCLDKLQGMFAFAIWDTNKQSLFLARDFLGIKPLYYYWNGDKFLFASEIKAIFAAKIEKKLNKNAVKKLLTYRFIPDEETMFENIYKIMPGEYLLLRKNKIIKKKYWDVGSDKVPKQEKMVDRLRSLLSESVKSHLVADVEVGSFLSGGIDSGLISALAQKTLQENGKPLKTFTAYFDHFSEREYAKILAEYIKSDHYEVYIDEAQSIKYLDKVIKQYDEPVIDIATIPTYILSKYSRRKVKVILAGEGGDEIFGGYEYYQRMKRLKNVLANVSIIFKLGKYLPQDLFTRKMKRAMDLYKKRNDLNEFYLSFSAPFKEEDIGEFLQEKKYPTIKINVNNYKQYINKLLYFEIKTLLPEYYLMKADKMTMAHGLEERVPLITPKIAGFAFSLPSKMKINGKSGKHILKVAAKNIVPKEIVTRKKIGYSVPYEQWITTSELGSIIETTIDASVSLKEIGEQKYVEKLIKDYKQSQDKAHKLWMIFTLLKWYDLYIA